MPAIELTESVSGAPTTLALRKNSADSPSLLERGGVRSGGSASVASSVFNLANTIMGTGMLALPHAFATAAFIVPAGSYFFLMPHEKWSAKRVGALVTLVAGIVLLPTCVAMVFIDT